MEYSFIQVQMKAFCQSKNWRNLTAMIDEGYKGMYVLLRILRESEGSVVAGELAKRMNVSTARIARALNTLEGKNYIKRERDKKDARKVVIRLTEQGEDALAERDGVVRAMVQPMLEKLTEEERRTLFVLLQKLLQ